MIGQYYHWLDVKVLTKRQFVDCYELKPLNTIKSVNIWYICSVFLEKVFLEKSETFVKLLPFPVIHTFSFKKKYIFKVNKLS